ncbi:hypothetical protein TVAG_171750 [Trichomonas vaginalis G3]|uniref:Uncharacterized protein n=1 Tax=Trichomonas vaginalis (strain ATCC PRA-98 / G3) TaxID=412133 RepID=A2EWA0_TRIV3|nr:progesterone-induced blocking factor 1 family [Trichomonas vaginalis G3]EAY03077.1 hypothetical protein TVAG_171750 [Trichomonas vaginalis G3]KAI5484810.1 progesterone-induced blocking factor 1 family [Trichomonas vaginalis G3]|eukprot:XP_001315300.1 hypothetical protein [Trichomonas vaginalis G3]
MNSPESVSSFSNIVNNLGLSSYSSSLIQEISDAISSAYSSSEITGTPDSVKSKLFLSPLRGDNSLKAQIKQRDSIIDAMRLKYNRTISKLTEQFQKYDEAISKFKQQYQEKTNELEALKKQSPDIQNLQEQIKQLKHEKKILQQKIKASREYLNLTELSKLSDEEYNQLKDQPDSSLSIPQFVAVQLYRRDREFARKISESDTQRNEARSEAIKLQAELETQQELVRSLTAKLASKSGSQVAAKPIGSDISSASTQKIERLESEITRLKATIDQFNQMQNESLKTEKKLISAQHEAEGLRKQIDVLSHANDDQKMIISDYRSQIERLTRSNDELMHRTFSTSEQRKTDIGSVIQTEVLKLAERSRSDIEFIREVTEKARQRETSTWEKNYNNAMDEIKKLRLDLRKSEEQRSSVQAEYQTLQLAHEAELTRVQSDLRVKTYELESIKLRNEELKAQLEDTTDERDAFAAKFDIIKQELVAKEADQKVTEEKIANLTEKVNMYEKLEGELDTAIENLDMQGASAINVPSDANRRVKQSIQLSKRVMTLQKQQTELTNELNDTKQKLAQKTDECNTMKDQLNAAGQPQQVFVQMLAEKQEQIKRLQKKIQYLSEQNQTLMMEKQNLSRDYSIIAHQQEDLKASKKISGCPFAQAPIEDEPTHEPVDPAPFIITRYD